MKVYIAMAIDYEEHRILGVFADETTAYIEGNARRPEREPHLSVGTVWAPITYEYAGHTFTNDDIFDSAGFVVKEWDVES
jgi:hypothetical protein